eukprot:TRINITY_DN2390_c0_g1_i1.p1 TRINITY_DN2390_c0_g1~~TRINITY_DN2390_c0_g1_i1.p1  ORF type:complete len:218 (+),score=13.98 TRINITY_DN2390_c0_g1_i1:34-687(+)
MWDSHKQRHEVLQPGPELRAMGPGGMGSAHVGVHVIDGALPAQCQGTCRCEERVANLERMLNIALQRITQLEAGAVPGRAKNADEASQQLSPPLVPVPVPSQALLSSSLPPQLPLRPLVTDILKERQPITTQTAPPSAPLSPARHRPTLHWSLAPRPGETVPVPVVPTPPRISYPVHAVVSPPEAKTYPVPQSISPAIRCPAVLPQPELLPPPRIPS